MKTRYNPFLRASFLASVSLVVSAYSALAGSSTWTGTQSTGTWITAGNWGAGVPGATSGTTNTDIATFNNIGYQTITLPTAENIGGITFATLGSVANPFFLTGGTLLPTAGAVIQTDSTYLGIANISSPITAQGALTLTANGAAGSGLFIGTTLATAASSTLTLNGSNAGFNSVFGNLITGIISGSSKVSKSGAGTWFLGAANTYTGGTDLNGGMLVVGNAAALGSAGTIAVLGNSTIRTTVGLTDPSARISISAGATLTLDTYNQAQTWAGQLNGGIATTGGLTKTGLNTLTITPAAGVVQTWTGATTVNMGTLTISGASQTANFTNLVNSSSALVLGGGNINFTGKVGFINSQTFNGTTLNAGISGFIPAAGTGTNTFDFGTITRNTGSLLDIVTSAGYTIKAGAMVNDAGGLVRGVLYNGDFATSTAGTLGAVTYTTQNAAASWTSATTNYTTGAAVTGSVGTATINSLRLNFAGSNSFAITGALSVNDGILFGSTIGANASTISGGVLTGPSGGGDLMVVNNNAQNATGRNTISSVIKDYATSDFAGAGANGTTNLVLYSRATSGALVLSGANTYTGNTYIGGGANAATGSMLTIVGVASGASIGSTSATVFVNGGTGGSTNVLQVGNSDTFGDVKGTIQLDNGKLSLKRTDTFTLSATVAGTAGGGFISQDSTGTATLTLASGTNLFQNLTSSAAGTLNLGGTGTYYFNSTATGFNAGSTTNFNSGAYYFTTTSTGANVIGNWAINGATVTLAGGRGFGGGGGTLTLNSGTFRVEGNNMNQEGAVAASFTYNINGGNFITTVNSNTAGAQSWGLGSGTAASTGAITANQTGGTVTVGSPENTNVSGIFTQLNIGVAATSHASTYNLSGGTLRSYGGISTAGAAGGSGSNNFNWTGGTLTTASYDATNLTSNDGISAAATGTLFQGGSTSVMAPGETFNGVLYTGKTAITNNYQIDGGAVNIGIGGITAAGAFHNTSTGTYDNISVTGTTVLGGRLNLALNNSYTPPNDVTTKYNVLVGTVPASSAVTGTFTNQQTAISGNSRVVLADGLSSFLVAVNNTAVAANTGGLTTVGARTVALGGYKAGNTYSGAGTAWDTASAAAWTNFDPGATATPATQASGAIAQFADGTASTGAIGVSLNSTRNIQGVQFSSAAGSRAYTISNGGSGAIILDNTNNSASATIADSSTSGTANAINVPITLNSNLAVSVTNAANNLTIGGVIDGTGKTLTKTGAGTLTLSGANTYSGATSITGGKLVVSGSGTLVNSDVSVTGSGVILASGSANTVGKTLVVGNGAILAAGDAGAAGTATVTNATTFNNGSLFSWDINATGVSYDKLVSGGGLVDGDAAGGSTFRVVLADTTFADAFWNTTRTWTNIFTTDGTTAIGSWASIFTSLTVVNGAFTSFDPSAKGSFSASGNTLTWTAVPEPTSALAGLLIGAGLLRRRRNTSSVRN